MHVRTPPHDVGLHKAVRCRRRVIQITARDQQCELHSVEVDDSQRVIFDDIDYIQIWINYIGVSTR
jgi:hypothetical protein